MKNMGLCVVSMFSSWVMVYELSKMCTFCNFVLTSAWNLSLLKQFTYMNRKVFIAVFQKMIQFIGVRATVHEILAIKKRQNSSISNTNISKTLSQSIINNTIFWKSVTRLFRCIYVNCFNILTFFACLIFAYPSNKRTIYGPELNL